MKNDHIALPESTLKRFREPNEENFYYIDLSNNKIHEKGPSTYQKIYGYYQKEFDVMCQSIETLMGNLHKSIDTLCISQGGNFYTSEYLKSIAIDILALQTVRRPEFFEYVTNPDVVLENINGMIASQLVKGQLTSKAIDTADMYRNIFSTPQKRRNFFYSTSFEKAKDLFIDMGQMQNYSTIIHIIPENIQATYLLTPYHYFIYCECYIITLSPRYAIVLMPNVAFEKLDICEGMVIFVADESNVLRLIPSVLEATYPCKQKHLVGERYMLNKIQEYLLNNTIN